MQIVTSRFGTIEVDDDRVLSFEKGLLGFPGHTQFALIQAGEENYFFWLQAVEDPNLAFVVTDPSIFHKDYEIPLRDEMQIELGLSDPSAAQVFVICNKVNDWLTGNLLGPLVVNAANRMGMQTVLTEKKWGTRQPLIRLANDLPLAQVA